MASKSLIPARGPAAFFVRMGMAAAVGVVAGIASIVFGDMAGPVGLALTMATNVVAMALCMLICVQWWRGIDEAAQEAHKWAWWWGGCTGMAVGGATLLTALSRDADRIDNFTANELLALGMALMLTCLMVGYGVAWAVWWAKRQ